MITFLIAIILLQVGALIILLWLSRSLTEDRKKLTTLLTENLAALRDQQSTIGQTADRLATNTDGISKMAIDLHDLGDWTRGQKSRMDTEDNSERDILALSQAPKEGVVGDLSGALITEVMLSKENMVAAALTQIIDSIYPQINDAVERQDYRQSEELLAKLHLILEKHLFRCPWNDLGNIYKRARFVTVNADERATAAIKSLSDVNEALAREIPERLLLLCFTKQELEIARTAQRIVKTTAAFINSCESLGNEMALIDPTNAHSSLKLSQLELRFAHLLSAQPSNGGADELLKVSDLLRTLKIRCQFYVRLSEAKITESGIKAAFERISTARTDLSAEVLHGYVFEEIDKAMAVCAMYLTIASELNTRMFDESCNAITQHEFLELKGIISEKQFKAYNSWALCLITETKKELKKKEPAIYRPTFDYKALALDLFPKVYNHVDESMINPSVSRLYYELHSKLIDLVKKDYDTVKLLIEGQVSHSKRAMYRLNDE